MEKGISGIFEPLIFQIIHWISKKANVEVNNKDIFDVLDVILENTTSRKSAKIRELASDCLAEYIKWYIKQHSDLTLKEKSGSIKYIIRKIETFAGHPDNFKKLGAVISFDKIIGVLGLNDSLVDKFILEITYYIINIMKNNSFLNTNDNAYNNSIKNSIDDINRKININEIEIKIETKQDKFDIEKNYKEITNYESNIYNKMGKTWDEINDIIYENIKNAIIKIKIIIKKKFPYLIKTNNRRLIYKDLRDLYIDLIGKLTANEIEMRDFAFDLISYIFDLFKLNNFSNFNSNSKFKDILFEENLFEILQIQNFNIYNNLNNELINKENHNDNTSIINKLKNIKNLSIKYDLIRNILHNKIFSISELNDKLNGILLNHNISFDYTKILLNILEIDFIQVNNKTEIPFEEFCRNKIINYQALIYINEVFYLMENLGEKNFTAYLMNNTIISILRIRVNNSILNQLIENLKRIFTKNYNSDIENIQILDLFLLSIKKLIIPTEKKSSLEKMFIFSKFETVSEIIKNSFAKILNLILEGNSELNNINRNNIFESITNKIQIFLSTKIELFNINIRESINNINDNINRNNETCLNLDNLSNDLSCINFSESTVEFYFDILFKIRKNLSKEFILRIRKNIGKILEIKNPKLNILLKSYYNFIYFFNFSYSLKLLTENEYNFDIIADWFYNLILTENQNSEFKIYDKKKFREKEEFKAPFNNKNKIESHLIDNNFSISNVDNNNLNNKNSNTKNSISFNVNFLGLEKEKIIEKFVEECAVNENKIFLLFILTEKAILGKNYNIVTFIAKIFVENLFKFTNVDSIINQIKISNLIIFNYIENSIFSLVELEKIFKIIDFYISENPINIIKEIVNFLGLLVKHLNFNQNNQDDKSNYNRTFPSENLNMTSSSNIRYFISEKLEKIRFFYIKIQSKYFPIKSRYLKPNTREYTDFQLIYNCFLNTFKTVKSLEFLELLFPIIREEKTEYSIRVKASLKEYIQDILDHENPDYRQKEIQKTIDIFLNKDIDKNLKDNIRFSIIKILTLKFLKKCDLIDLKEIFVKNYKKFFEIVKINIIDSSLSYEMKFSLILEKY